MDSYRLISVSRQQDVYCVRLKQARLEEIDITDLGYEILSLCSEPGCKLALSLGPEPPYCLYSVFLAKLIAIRNALQKNNGRLVLCEVGPNAYSVFEATKLDKEFTFAANFNEAVAHLNGES